ncbi:MAG: hypothetical protein COA78_34835 [Blastopirellula sp.]|nr:MAG: hypothetical protein COA78_34835 [Blastopirellula sp.]
MKQILLATFLLSAFASTASAQLTSTTRTARGTGTGFQAAVGTLTRKVDALHNFMAEKTTTIEKATDNNATQIEALKIENQNIQAEISNIKNLLNVITAPASRKKATDDNTDKYPVTRTSRQPMNLVCNLPYKMVSGSLSINWGCNGKIAPTQPASAGIIAFPITCNVPSTATIMCGL